jgi:hypothetical protein
MYLQLISAATSTLKASSDAYTNSERDRVLGVYMVVVSHTTHEFFQTLTVDAGAERLHAAFLDYLASAEAAITEELELGEPVDSQRAHNFMNATKRFAGEYQAFVTK